MTENKRIRCVSIIIPVYNEKETILKVLENVIKAEAGFLKKEIIIVDDGSTDGSRELLRNINADVKVFFHLKNKGKGAAIRTGLQHATGDIVLIQDADLEYNPNNYNTLLHPIQEGTASVVYGYRFQFRRTFDKNMYYTHCIGNIILTLMTNILYNANLNDMETGYKVMKRDILHDIELKADGFDIEPEITAKILKKGIKIYQVPIEFKPRSFDAGKKITWKDGIIAAGVLIRCKF